MWGTMPRVQPIVAINPRRRPPPIELDTVYTTPVPEMRTTTSDVSRNSIDTFATLVAPGNPVKNIVYQGSIDHRLVTGG